MLLSNIVIVDLTRYLPGPYCTRMLADLGASVIKIEPLAGDPMQSVAWYDALNRGKRVVRLDLKDEAQRAELAATLKDADVVIEGFRPSTAKALGVDAAAIRSHHPRLIHCSITGYGQKGSDAERSGHDINYQCEAGLLTEPPTPPSFLVADLTGGLHATIQILAALVARGRTGEGASLDVSLFASAAAWAPFKVPEILSGAYACYNMYETADGRWIALGALEAKFWQRFCNQLARPQWIALQFAEDPQRSMLLAEVREMIRSRSQSSWTQTFSGVDCCFTPVR